jgi:hypothetical protein
MTTPSVTMLIVIGKYSLTSLTSSSFDIFKDFIIIYSFLYFLLVPIALPVRIAPKAK